MKSLSSLREGFTNPPCAQARGRKPTKQSIKPTSLRKQGSQPALGCVTRVEWIASHSLAMTTTLFLIFLFPANLALARDYCKNASNAAEFRECGDIYYQMEDKAMTVVYERLINVLKKQDKEEMLNNISREKHLREAQRAWIEFRDKNCDADSTIVGYGGTIMMDLHQGCMLAMTKNRGLELQTTYDLVKGE